MVVRRKSGKGDTEKMFLPLLNMLCQHLQIWKLWKLSTHFFWIIRHFQNKAIIFSPEECFGDSHLLNYFPCLGPVLGWWDHPTGVELSAEKTALKLISDNFTLYIFSFSHNGEISTFIRSCISQVGALHSLIFSFETGGLFKLGCHSMSHGKILIC